MPSTLPFTSELLESHWPQGNSLPGTEGVGTLGPQQPLLGNSVKSNVLLLTRRKAGHLLAFISPQPTTPLLGMVVCLSGVGKMELPQLALRWTPGVSLESHVSDTVICSCGVPLVRKSSG